MALKNNTWKLNQWYDQDVAGNVSYSGTKELWTWGFQESGGFGINIGGNLARSSPVQLPGTTWTTEFYNDQDTSFHAVMSKTDGTLWSWGKGSDWGQLGLNQRGPGIRYSSPVQIGSGTDWKLGGTTREGSFAIKTDGTFYTWGSNQQGELGQSNRDVRSSPVQIPGTTWNKAFGGYNNILATKTDGTLWAIGEGAYGVLAQNNTTDYSSPVQIGSDTTWSSASINQARGVGAIKTDGTLWMWGLGTTGSLGQNSTVSYSSPVQVTGSWSYYECGGDGAVGRKTDGTLWTWGENSNGRLGQNQAPAQIDRISSPTQIPGTNWNRISSSDNSVLASKTDGTLWAWGSNGQGKLGLNQAPAQLAAASSPVQIPGTSWVTVGNTGQGNIAMATKNV